MIVCLPNRRQVRGRLHQLSTSGGVIHLEGPLDEKIVVELVFHLGHATMREKVQTLFPMWATQGWLQPFRFINLSADSHYALETNLQSFIERTIVERTDEGRHADARHVSASSVANSRHSDSSDSPVNADLGSSPAQ